MTLPAYEIPEQDADLWECGFSSSLRFQERDVEDYWLSQLERCHPLPAVVLRALRDWPAPKSFAEMPSLASLSKATGLKREAVKYALVMLVSNRVLQLKDWTWKTATLADCWASQLPAICA